MVNNLYHCHLLAVPDLETVKFKVLKRTDQYEIREVEVYVL